jgi:hypothetical protein
VQHVAKKAKLLKAGTPVSSDPAAEKEAVEAQFCFATYWASESRFSSCKVPKGYSNNVQCFWSVLLVQENLPWLIDTAEPWMY